MASTFFGLNIGLSGLYAYQASINTTAHNISNAETKGYSRQSVVTSASEALRVYSSYGMAGSGVDIVDIIQQRSAYYDVKYRNSSALYGEYSTKNDYMLQVQNYFNEVDEGGFTDVYNDFFKSLNTLSDDPSSSDIRTTVANNAASLSEYMNYMYNSMRTIQEDANFQIKNLVDRVNSLGEQIATVTKQINALEVTGVTANDLRDARENLVDELSKIVNVSTEEKVVKQDPMDPGTVVYEVRINNQLLVDTSTSKKLMVVPREEKINESDLDGLYDVTWGDGQAFSLSNANLKGELKALYEVRDGNNAENLGGGVTTTTANGKTTLTLTKTNCDDITKLNLPLEGNITIAGKDYKYTGFNVEVQADGTYKYNFNLDTPLKTDITAADKVRGEVGETVNYKGIPYYITKLNEFSRTFAMVFNGMHNAGQDLDGNAGLDYFNFTEEEKATGLLEKFTTFNADGTATYVDASGNTVTGASYYKLTAYNLTITNEIMNDPRKFAACGGDIVQGVENKDNLTELLKLEDDKSLFKAGTPAQFYNTLVAEIGVDAAKYETFANSQESIMNSITNQRLSIAGVDVDEEAMNLVKFKNAYNLSAKVIQTMNEIYDKLINGTGV
ncbi:flagellar hook-associated protein FlgK [Anaerosporobacter sp.]|uniref:flagellar hook-associated protein FlgK n=1 Tax=Anaerosporobacter sp. TaxID=1872529 RepID=UPI00286F521B|nr:flagellar hook-associated protein FlgK [Anaerosporobacter sp.]